jgi:hypothetical protein
MILYRHPHRPDEAGITVVADEARAVVMQDRLEKQGFMVTKIVESEMDDASS